MKKLVLIFILLFVKAFAEDHSHEHHHQAAGEKKAVVSEESVYNVTHEWTDKTGKKQKLSTLKGKVMVVAMVYTSCQYACPLITADIKKIESMVPENIKSEVRYALFSFDPARDNPHILTLYSEKKALGSAWNLYTSTEKGVRELAAVLGIKYKKDSKGDFDHSNIVFVLNKEGEVVHQQVGLNQDSKETVESIKKLLK